MGDSHEITEFVRRIGFNLDELVREEERRSRPSASLVIYCDRHLGSKMIRRWSLLLFQGGGDSADCNPFPYWGCLHARCHRAYDPYDYGYFWFSRELGSRIETDFGRGQQRCGCHAETPFMCITQKGRGRQYICPFYGCGETGAIVAQDVVDENHEMKDSQPTSMGKNQQKELIELSIFSEFAQAALLYPDTARNAAAPHPDIECTINGEKHRFELGRITNSTLAAATSGKSRTQSTSGFSFSQEEPLVNIIEKKKTKNYEGRPVDLILHFDQHPADHSAVERHIEKHRNALNSLTQRGPFSRVWIYDKWSKKVIWKSR